MGLFLQKTNIIRDYLEDQQEGREFWPREVTDMWYLGEKNFQTLKNESFNPVVTSG